MSVQEQAALTASMLRRIAALERAASRTPAALTAAEADIDALEASHTAWTEFTAVWTGYTRGNGADWAVWRYAGRSIEIMYSEILGSTSVVGTSVELALPTADTILTGIPEFTPFGGEGHFRDISGVTTYLAGFRKSATGLRLGGGYTWAQMSATYPITWVTNDAFRGFVVVPIN